MSLSRTVEKCQLCPIRDICDNKVMEALATLPLPCESMTAAQPESVNYAALQEGIDKIRQEIYDFAGVPKEILEADMNQYEYCEKMFVEPMKSVVPIILKKHFIFK